MRRYIHAGVVSGILLAAGSAQAAQVVISEAEPNSTITYAQKIDASSGNVAISAVLGNLAGSIANDTDFYEFHAMAGDVLTLDIDGANGGARSFDSYIAIFGPGPTFEMLRANDDVSPISPIDEGSSSRSDSRLENFTISASGYYVVGVTAYDREFRNGGNLTTGKRFGNGDYKLIITGVTPDIQQINIEVKPGNDAIAPINPRSKGKIPVALLSSLKFDAMNVDASSLTFGATGDENSFSHCGRSGEDVNGDGRLDLVCHFENEVAGFEKGDLEGIVRGKMKWGTRIEGRAFLKVLNEKRGS
jgi:hypothetical protein